MIGRSLYGFCFLLATLGWIPVQAAASSELGGYLKKPLQSRIKLFQQTGESGRGYLRRVAFDSQSELRTRWRAVTTMGKWDAAGFQPELNRALTSKEWFMRNAGLIAMQFAPRAQAIEWSTRLLHDPALVVRTQAVRNIISLRATESEAVLWQEIFAEKNFRSGESLWVRGHMAEALAKLCSAGRARSFQRLLLEADPRLHRWAVVGLERTTGFVLTSAQDPIEVRRQKWLSRLGAERI